MRHTANNCDKSRFLMRINIITDFKTQDYSFSQRPKEDEYVAEFNREEMDTHNSSDSDNKPPVKMLTTPEGQKNTIQGRNPDGPLQQMGMDTGSDLNIISSNFLGKQAMSNQTTLDKLPRQADGSRINGLKVLLPKIELTTINLEEKKISNWMTFHVADT
jgi:hypothetical protein